MNNKEKYIAEVDSLKAGEGLKNAILENAQINPKKNVYKKIIPLAACLVIALLVALPGFVFRAGRAKNAAQEFAYDAAVAENEIAAADENADSKSAYSKSESAAWYADDSDKKDSLEIPAVILTFSDSKKSFVLDNNQTETVYGIISSADKEAESSEETDTADSDYYVEFDSSDSSCNYYPETGIAYINGAFYKLDDASKNALDAVLNQFTDH
ncbi:MAG: hypothetical protein IK063_04210 [Clostridia bacterium]|nr:hypothetical protein [Clostridia bacterium]